MFPVILLEHILSVGRYFVTKLTSYILRLAIITLLFFSNRSLLVLFLFCIENFNFKTLTEKHIRMMSTIHRVWTRAARYWKKLT